VIALELVDADSGFAGVIGDVGSVVFDHGEVLALGGPDEAEVAASDDGARARLATSQGELELELSPLGPRAVLETEWMPSRELFSCRGSGTLSSDGKSASFSGVGVLARSADGADLGGDSLHRYLAVAFADGGLLALAAARSAGGNAHGDEAVKAVLVGPDSHPQALSEVLLSTEYDRRGRHRRATLELWTEEEPDGPPLRAGGELICGTTLPGDGPRTDVAFMRWSLEGRPGLGRYEVIRQP
jgi:hypothetical protein